MNTLTNTIQVTGKIGYQPQIKRTPTGKKEARIQLTSQELIRNKDGRKTTTSTWYNVIFSGSQVDLIEHFLTQGKEIMVTGNMTFKPYHDTLHNKRYVTEIIGKNLKIFNL